MIADNDFKISDVSFDEKEFIKYIYNKDFGKETDEKYELKIKELILFKKDIILKYEEKFLEKLKRNDVRYLHKLSKCFDKYLLHIIEEVSEFSEETESSFKNNGINDDMLLELIDIISYICSLLFLLKYESTFSKNLNERNYTEEIKSYTLSKNYNDNIVFIEDYIKEIEPYTGRFNLTKLSSEITIISCINSYLTKFCVNELIDARRLFLERKWHKLVSRVMSVYELKEFYNKLEIKLVNVLASLIYLFLYLTDFNYEKFDSMYKSKGEKVFNNLET